MDPTKQVLEEMRRETRQQILAMRRAFLTLVDELERIVGTEPRTAELRKRYREKSDNE